MCRDNWFKTETRSSVSIKLDFSMAGCAIVVYIMLTKSYIVFLQYNEAWKDGSFIYFAITVVYYRRYDLR